MNNLEKFHNVFKLPSGEIINKPVIGMLHMKGMTRIEARSIAKVETRIMVNNGIDAVLVEDFFNRNNLNYVREILGYLSSECKNVIYGVNFLNDWEKSFELADNYGAKFIQIDSISGHLKKEDDKKFVEELNYYRRKTGIFVLGGVRFKYQPVVGNSLTYDLITGMERCDAIVVTGEKTGLETDLTKIREFRSTIDDFPLVVGAGLTADNCREQLESADGAIVGTFIKDNCDISGDVSPTQVNRLMGQVKKLRK